MKDEMKAVEGWETKHLGELLVTKNNKAKQIKSSEYSAVGSYPVVDQSSDFICGYNDDLAKLIDSDLPLTIFGDHTRHTKFVDFPFIAGADGTQLLKPKQGIEDKFFYYLVELAADKIGNFGYDRHFKHLKEYSCNYPRCKPEQSKIAEILSTVDQAIEQTEALIAKQQRIKTGLMQDLLTRGIDEHGNLRSEETHKFKDSPLGRIPVEWEVENLFSRALVKGGKRLPAGHVYAEGDTKYRYLQTTDFIGKQLIYNELHYLFEKTFRVLERYEIIDGDVFISIAGVNLGAAGVFRPDFSDKTVLTENAARIHVLPGEVPEYLAMQLNGPTVQKQILEDKGIGAGVPKLALFRIQQFLIPWSNKEEQLEVVRCLDVFDNAIRKQKDELGKLRSLKTALMQDLLTGKKRVTDLLKNQITTH